MDEFRNTNPFNGYTASWTQPYLPTSYNPFYDYEQQEQARERAVELEHLLYDLECIDEQVDEMLTYPDAEAIINKLRHRGE
jgi:hypothetical protein